MERPVEAGFDLHMAWKAMVVVRGYSQGLCGRAGGRLTVHESLHADAVDACRYADARWGEAPEDGALHRWGIRHAGELAVMKEGVCRGLGVPWESLGHAERLRLATLMAAALEYAAVLANDPQASGAGRRMVRDAERLAEKGGLDDHEVARLLVATSPREMDTLRERERVLLREADEQDSQPQAERTR